MQHKASRFTFQTVDQLCVTGNTQSGGDQSMGFATGEQGGTMGLWQNANFDVQLAHSLGITTVDTWLAIQDSVTYVGFFQLAEQALDFAGRRRFSTANCSTASRAVPPECCYAPAFQRWRKPRQFCQQKRH